MFAKFVDSRSLIQIVVDSELFTRAKEMNPQMWVRRSDFVYFLQRAKLSELCVFYHQQGFSLEMFTSDSDIHWDTQLIAVQMHKY